MLRFCLSSPTSLRQIFLHCSSSRPQPHPPIRPIYRRFPPSNKTTQLSFCATKINAQFAADHTSIGTASRSSSSSHADSSSSSGGIRQATSERNEDRTTNEEDYWDKVVLFEDVKLLTKFKTPYNFVRVLEVARQAHHPAAGSRVLLLDRPGNVQSIYNPYKTLTNSYYDVFATLPPLLPDGPLAVLGLGAGTTARLLLHFWRGLEIHGWEIDPAVITVARQYFDLLDLEEGRLFPLNDGLFCISTEAEDNTVMKRSKHSNGSDRCKDENGYEDKLCVHIGDALQSDALSSRTFAGIFVDLFTKGAVIPPLQMAESWQNLKEKLTEGGRIMVNCGGSCVEAEGVGKKDGHVTMEETLHAMSNTFHGQLLKIEVGKRRDSIVALTGPIPDLSSWRKALPDDLRMGTLDMVAAV